MATADLSKLENGTITAGVSVWLRQHLSPPLDTGSHWVTTDIIPYYAESGELVTQESHIELGWTNQEHAIPPEITGRFPANIPGVEDLAGIPLNQLYQWNWIPSEQEVTPGYWNFTPIEPRLRYDPPHTSQTWWQGFTDWNQWRPAFEYVGVALGTAAVGGEVFAPVAEGAGAAAAEGVALTAEESAAIGGEISATTLTEASVETTLPDFLTGTIEGAQELGQTTLADLLPQGVSDLLPANLASTTAESAATGLAQKIYQGTGPGGPQPPFNANTQRTNQPTLSERLGFAFSPAYLMVGAVILLGGIFLIHARR